MPIALVGDATGASAVLLGYTDPLASEPSPRVRLLRLDAQGAESLLLDARADSGFGALAGAHGGGFLVGLSHVRDSDIQGVGPSFPSTLVALELDPAGTLLRALPITANQPGAVLTAVHGDDAGRLYVAGRFRGQLTLTPGTVLQTDLHSGDLFCACFGPQNELLWAHVGGTRGGLIRGLHSRPDGSIVATGWFSRSLSFGGESVSALGSRDAFVAVFDTQGQATALARAGGAGASLDLTGTVDVAGGVVLAGSATGSFAFGETWVEGAFPQAAVVLRFNANLVPEWAKSFGSGRSQGISAVSSLDTGGVALAGDFEGRMDLGDGERSAVSARDAFVAALDANGQLTDAAVVGAQGEHGAPALASTPLGLRLAVFSTGAFAVDEAASSAASLRARVVGFAPS